MAEQDQAPVAADAQPITPPPEQGTTPATSATEQASPASESASESPESTAAAPDPDAERIAWLKSLPPAKLLEYHEDLARRQQDEINKGIQRTLAKQQAAEQRKREAEAAAQAAAEARAQREAEKAAKRELALKGLSGEYDTVEQLSRERLEQLLPEAFGPDVDLDAYARQVEDRALQETTDKVVNDLRAHRIARHLSDEDFTRIFQQPNYGDVAEGLAEASGWVRPEQYEADKKAWEAHTKTAVEAAIAETRAELLGEVPEHVLPRGVSANGKSHVWTRDEIANLSTHEWRLNKKTIEQQAAAGLIR